MCCRLTWSEKQKKPAVLEHGVKNSFWVEAGLMEENAVSVYLFLLFYESVALNI